MVGCSAAQSFAYHGTEDQGIRKMLTCAPTTSMRSLRMYSNILITRFVVDESDGICWLIGSQSQSRVAATAHSLQGTFPRSSRGCRWTLNCTSLSKRYPSRAAGSHATSTPRSRPPRRSQPLVLHRPQQTTSYATVCARRRHAQHLDACQTQRAKPPRP